MLDNIMLGRKRWAVMNDTEEDIYIINAEKLKQPLPT